MTPLEVFSLHLFVSLVFYFLFGRSLKLPIFVKFITIILYLNVPIYVAVQAAPSSIYLSDALAPVLLLQLILNKAMRAASKQSVALIMLGFFVILPAFLFFVHVLVGTGGIQDERDVFGAILWYYRQCTIALLFLYGLSLRLDAQGLSAFAHLNFIMGSVLVGFAAINYISSVNLAVFDQLLAVNVEYGDFYVDQNRIGYGFLGLFRASAGQWCATLAIFLLGMADTRSLRTRVLYSFIAVCSIGCVLASMSRAGVVALAVGLIVLSLFGRGWMQRLFVMTGLGIGAYLVLESSGTFVDRTVTIFTASDDSSQSRLAAWDLAIRHFTQDTQTFFLGIGPTNDRGMSLVTGTWGAHNEMLDVALKLGFMGLPLWAMLINSLLRNLNMKRRVSRKSEIYSSTMIAVLIANIFVSLTQNHLLHTYSTYTICAFLIWLYGVATSPWPDRNGPSALASNHRFVTRLNTKAA